MKYDLDLIEKILEKIEEGADGRTTVWITEKGLGNKYSEGQIFYHIETLLDAGLIITTGESCGMQHPIKMLTMEGRQFLEAKKNSALWSRVKKGVVDSGVEGLKMIPSLAIGVLISSLGTSPTK